MALVKFELPDELLGVTADTINRDMLAKISNAYDKTEGGFLFDMTKPSALEAAELLQFWLVLALQTNFHMWATGRWLDYHARACGLSRRAPTNAIGDLKIVTKKKNLVFDEGFVFSVPGENGVAAIDFEATEKVTCGAIGEYIVPVRAVESGTYSNVKADSITIMKNPIAGVASITNEEAMMGGTEPESDDSLRQRIDDFYAGRMASFVGNKKDYIRWAKEVPGVGYAHCIPTYNGPNTVKVVVADMNGDPANEEILKAVKLYIFGTGHEDLNRLAPIGIVEYAVVAPTLEKIDYSFDVKLEEGYTLAQVEELVRDNLKAHYMTLTDDDNNYGVLRYVAVSDVLFHTSGIVDFKHLRVGGEIANVEFGADKIPSTRNITMTEYE